MDRPLLLDLFCGAGGAAWGYHLAGFEVVGVDLAPQRRYPFRFVRADAIGYLRDMAVRGRSPLGWPAVIHASPPCQAYTKARKLQGNTHPELVGPVRDLLGKLGLPFVIENVPGAPLLDPITLCGASFGLRVYRHRLFESTVELTEPPHRPHDRPQTKMGRPPRPGEMIQVVGHFSGADEGRAAMGIPWMVKAELAEAIPPAYSEFVGRQLLASL